MRMGVSCCVLHVVRYSMSTSLDGMSSRARSGLIGSKAHQLVGIHNDGTRRHVPRSGGIESLGNVPNAID